MDPFLKDDINEITCFEIYMSNRGFTNIENSVLMYIY